MKLATFSGYFPIFICFITLTLRRLCRGLSEYGGPGCTPVGWFYERNTVKKLIREFFFLRRGERRALMVVMVLLGCIVSVRLWHTVRPLPGSESTPVFYADMVELKSRLLLAAEMEERIRKEERERYLKELKAEEKHTGGIRKELMLFAFDPNTIPADSLRLMQLPGFVAENIVRYRKAGGTFRKPEEIGKIYGMDTALYEEILPYVFIKNQELFNSEQQFAKRSGYISGDTIPTFSLNEADSAMLTMIPGIGPAYSMRIIRYRELLGGFYEPEQLMEVYGMDTTMYRMISKFCMVDRTKIRQIDLNRASFKELIGHPYIDRSETYAILHYRNYADSIADPRELLINQILDQERFARVAPYLATKRWNE
jgi:competence protein ComEA